MASTTTRTLRDRHGVVKRMIKALGNDPTEWDPEDLLMLAEVDHLVAKLRGDVVQALRSHGETDTSIGKVLGITQQAVTKRWPRPIRKA